MNDNIIQPGNNPNQQYSQSQQYDPNQQYSPNQQYNTIQPHPQPSQPPPYQPQQQYPVVPQKPHMKVGEWLVTKLLLLIPFVGIVMIFIWAFGSNVNPSKKSYFQAELIWAAIGIVIATVTAILVGNIIVNWFSDLFYYWW